MKTIRLYGNYCTHYHDLDRPPDAGILGAIWICFWMVVTEVVNLSTAVCMFAIAYYLIAKAMELPL